MPIKSQEPFKAAGYELLMRWVIVSSTITLAISLKTKKCTLGIAQSPRRIKEKNIQVSSHEDSGGNGNEEG